MLWQAESGFWFTMAGGYLSPTVPAPFRRFRAVHPRLAASTSDILALARAKNVHTIIVDGRQDVRLRALLPGPPAGVGGVLLYRLPHALQSAPTHPGNGAVCAVSGPQSRQAPN